MKFNFNGDFFESNRSFFEINNRAFLYGDFILEPIKIANQTTSLWEEHYFNLMASMRIFRMKIPQNFTPEFLLQEIQKTCKENNVTDGLVELIIFRNNDSENLITDSTISYLVRFARTYSTSEFLWEKDQAEIDIFKDLTVNPTFFSQVNSHKSEENIALSYMQENDYQDLILLNPTKKIAKSLLGNVFLIQENTIKTPKISEGGIRSVLRNHLCKLLGNSEEFNFEEAEIFPFELQKADELFVCIEGFGLKSIHKNRKKSYNTEKTQSVIDLLNS